MAEQITMRERVALVRTAGEALREARLCLSRGVEVDTIERYLRLVKNTLDEAGFDDPRDPPVVAGPMDWVANIMDGPQGSSVLDDAA